jgi:prolyl oligopeptidase
MSWKSLKPIAVVMLAGFVLVGCSQAGSSPGGPIVYPKTAKVEQVDDYHGVKVADPYRWLEDLDSPQTKEWVEAENKVTFAYLKAIPAREKIKARLTKLWNYEKYGLPEKEDGRYFFAKNDGLQNQSVVYTVKSLDDQPQLLIDPNLLSKDGTVALAGYAISDDGKYMAYGVSGAGSDWEIYHVRDVETAKDLPDEIKWVKFSGASWTKDGKGFFYSRYDEPKSGDELKGLNYYHKLYYHKLGTTQDQDPLIYHRPDQKEWEFGGYVTEDGRYLIITIFKGTARETRVSYKDLQSPDSKVIDLLTDFDAQYGFVGNDGPVFWFQTDFNAPRRRVIAVDTSKSDRANWKEIIPQATETLEGVSVVNDMFICSYLKDAYTQVKIFDLGGKAVRDVKLPSIGSAGGFGGKRKDKETFYSFTSFSYPTTIYRYDMVTGESTVFKRPTVDFNSDEYETKQVFYTSKDGTKVPMFIVFKKGLQLDGTNPTLLYGYGGFDVSLSPSFSISRAVWMEMGGVYAMANLRGGGEYGKAWHDAGRLANKQNCFDDFIAAAEWLIANKYTRTEKLAILGGSNGGLLVGAVETQRPDLFGACLPAVGVMDMLRFKRFTCGWEWVSDYGDVDKPDDFKVLHAYSPLQNIKPGTKYPPTMITTADHDDRVVPLHSFKFAAALQTAQAGPAPILIRIETRAGHGAGKPTWMTIEEQADQWAFLVHTLGMDETKIKM